MWTEWDRACALVWQAEQALLCSGCGMSTVETMDPASEDQYVARKLKCHACATRDVRNGKDVGAAGMFFSVSRRDGRG